MINSHEVWAMYFRTDDVLQELEQILSGHLVERQDNYFYPTGRCEMFRNMLIVFNNDAFIRKLKERVAVYPQIMRERMISLHMKQLWDLEDLKRGAERGDELFFHFALDIATDNFLQTLFALNSEYFPSRKRSLQYMKDFAVVPPNCDRRLLQLISLASSRQTLDRAYLAFQETAQELSNLVAREGLSGLNFQ